MSCTLIVGPPACGKTELAKKLMQNELRQIHFHDPKKQKLFELELSGTERMLDFIEEELKEDTRPKNARVVIFDDLYFDWRRKLAWEPLMEFVTQNRKHGVHAIFIVQTLSDATPETFLNSMNGDVFVSCHASNKSRHPAFRSPIPDTRRFCEPFYFERYMFTGKEWVQL